MPKLLVQATMELAFEFPEGTNPDELVRLKERRLVTLLQRLTREEERVEGSLECLELESFCYAEGAQGEPSAYYYNKHERAANSGSSS